jgi:hypothetical protein
MADWLTKSTSVQQHQPTKRVPARLVRHIDRHLLCVQWTTLVQRTTAKIGNCFGHWEEASLCERLELRLPALCLCHYYLTSSIFGSISRVVQPFWTSCVHLGKSLDAFVAIAYNGILPSEISPLLRYTPDWNHGINPTMTSRTQILVQHVIFS